MTETQGPVELPGGTIVPIGHLAAQNITAGLRAQHGIEVGVEAVEQAIRDEIQVMSSHFTTAVADVQTQYEAEVLKIKRSVAGVVAAVAQDKRLIASVAAAVFALGVALGRVL